VEPFRVGILGATGLVGQRLVRLLDGHPWFTLGAVAASDRSAGARYAEAVAWRLGGDPPTAAAGLVVRGCGVEDLADCDLLFSGLDARVAGEVEASLRRAGYPLVSNSSAFRQHDDVPLVIPEVNADHLALLDRQSNAHGGGYIVTNPNCSTTGLALALAPLHAAFGVRRVVVATLQAISGAGAEGPRALELQDNVIPYIAGEEEKVERELRKILGRADALQLQEAAIDVSAHCHRVPTLDGHLHPHRPHDRGDD